MRYSPFSPRWTIFGAAGSSRNSPGPLDGGAILTSVFAGARGFASGLFTTVLLLYFLLVSGDSFLRRLVEVLPRFSSKRQAVEIAQQIQSDISAYLVTITAMSAGVGAATAFVMWSTGVGDPVLWGTVAFFLNFVPILRSALRLGGISVRRPRDHRFAVAGAPPGCALRGHPSDGGRDIDPNAFGADDLPSIPFLSSCRWSSGPGCGVFPAQFCRRRSWRSSRSSATEFGRLRRWVTFSRGDWMSVRHSQALPALRGSTAGPLAKGVGWSVCTRGCG